MNAPTRLALGAALLGACLTFGVLPVAGQAGAGGAPQATATFAGGCFWCMEPPFDAIGGVVSTTSGYTGGRTPTPTYEDVSHGDTGHAEALQVVFDPAKVTYKWNCGRQQRLDQLWGKPSTP